ncbi:TIGR01777 family oxidoreductase [Flavobacterium suncheonense]|uniref:NAD-dependent epimerase n=1 Tax=Flavobacterium suncheonense GH29-5 = DSM 17707 TaxID=1121899 RepID=A0A0A2MAK2_9FLAO|nr:TIGR01777 family oxidoreductase [Flavobacterium suncheonense]KGO89299.1 NAD-dependent epimerase [Flavobacterium suncheonense GH29-5 = DSM 17707]
MKIIIAAGTGFLGNVLIGYFQNQSNDIVVLTRGKTMLKNNIRYIHWNAKTMTGWEKELENADVLINLAGKSVDCRYNEANKKEILLSRIKSTKLLNKAVLQCQNPPKHWLNASTATIYRHSEDQQMDEYTGEIGNDFSMNVAQSWEKAFFKTETPNTKKTALRTSIVLGKKGGAFPPLKNLTQLGFGGKQGNGNQFISWIHEEDFARAVAFVVEKEITGKINIVAPEPIQNRFFMKALRKEMKVSFGAPLGKRMLKFGAKIIGTETELVLKSRNIIPKRLTENGFTFRYTKIDKVFQNLLGHDHTKANH